MSAGQLLWLKARATLSRRAPLLKADLEIVRRVAPNATADDADQSRRHATGNAAGRG